MDEIDQIFKQFHKDVTVNVSNNNHHPIEVFNKEYQPKQPLTLEIVNNYSELMDYIKNNLKP